MSRVLKVLDEILYKYEGIPPQGFDDGGQVIGKPGGLVEPGVTHYGKKKKKLTSAQEFHPNKVVERLGSTMEEFNKATEYYTDGKVKKWSDLGGKENEEVRKKIRRNIKNHDGIYVKPKNVGGASGKELTQIQKEKILKYWPEATFTDNYFGVPPGHEQYEKIKEFVKRDFKIRANFDPLPVSIQNELKQKFTLPEGKKWDFNRLKYGYSSDTLLGKAISQHVNKPKPWKYSGVQLTTPEGWFMAQMGRAFENGITIDGKTLAYEAIKNKNGKIIGFIDNTKKGNGKRYVVNKKWQGKNDLLINKHVDFDNTKKWFNFAKNADVNPSKAITDILSKGGVNVEGLRTSTILDYLVQKTPSTAKLKRAIVMHHKGGLNKATSDFQILDRVVNRKALEIENLMRADPKNITKENIGKLKKWGVTVEIGGKTYGSGPQTMERGVKKIENLILKGSRDVDLYGKKIKGIEQWGTKDFKDLSKYLKRLCPNKASGGRVGMKVAGSVGVKCGADRFKQVFKDPSKGTQAERQLVGRILRSSGSAAGRKALYALGPAGIGIDALVEGAIWGDDVLGGASGKEAYKDLWISYLDPRAYTGGLKVSGDRYNETEIAKTYGGDTAKFYKLAHAIEDKYRLQNKLQLNEEMDVEGTGITLSPQQQNRLEEANTIIENAGGEEAAYSLLKEDSPLFNAAQISSERFEEVGPGKDWDRKMLAKGPLAQIRRDQERKKEMDLYPTYDMFITPSEYKAMDLEQQREAKNVIPELNLTERANIKDIYDIPASDNLSEYVYPDTGKSIFDEENLIKKWNYLINTKGMRGTQDTRYAGGGIAGIRRPHAIPPKSGPMPQGGGLSSMFNRVRKW